MNASHMTSFPYFPLSPAVGGANFVLVDDNIHKEHKAFLHRR